MSQATFPAPISQINLQSFAFSKNNLIALGIITIMLILPSFLFGDVTASQHESEIRARNAAFGMPIVALFGFLASAFLQRKTVRCIYSFSANSDHKISANVLLNEFTIRLNRIFWPSVITGVVVTLAYNIFEGLLTFDTPPLYLYLIVIAPLYWASMSYLVLTLFVITTYVLKHFLDKNSIDFFSIKELTPMSDLVIYNIVACAGLLALTPIFWIGRKIPLTDITMLLFIFIILAYCLFIPVLRVHIMISRRKQQAIERINCAVRKLMIENGYSKQSQFLDSPEKLRMLASLLHAKSEIGEASEWPIEMPQGVKGILLSLSIPASWATGSIIESWMSGLPIFS